MSLISFAVTRVAPAQKILAETTVANSIKQLLTPTTRGDRNPSVQKPKEGEMEACHNPEQAVIVDAPFHPLFAAAHRAFMDHRPLTLSPDMIWLTIAQGFAQHVNNNAEGMRDKFVKHSGKATITVRRDDFVKGKKNPWPEVFEEFSKGVLANIGMEMHQKLTAQFTTTGVAEKAANEIVLMDTVKAYFEYVLMTRCGIPTVNLEGTTEDWKQLQTRVESLTGLIPSWWKQRLDPICEQFVLASKGSATPTHWNNIYKWHSHSGSDSVDGWLSHLLPYIKGDNGVVDRQNPFKSGWGGMSTGDIPAGLSACPFIWDYHGNKIPMNFLAGFVGATQDHQTLAVRPMIGWAVV